MQLFYSLTSPYARKVRVVLVEKGIHFDGIDVAKSDRQPSEYNPLGKVPTLVLPDGTVWYDSTVITEALDQLYPVPRLIPENPYERACVRRWEALADGLCDVLIPVVHDTLRPPELRNTQQAEKVLGKMHRGLTYLETALAGRRYLHGDGFGLADVATISMLGYVGLRRPELLDQGYPEIKRYHAEQLERPSLRDTIPPNLPIPGSIPSVSAAGTAGESR